MKVYFKVWLLTVLALALAALVIIILATQPARAAGPWYVAPGGSDGDLCTSPGTACASINGALAKPGFVISDTILVATGTYTGTGDEVVLLNKNATLSGGWDASFTTQSGTSTIDGEGSRRGITVNSGGTAVVERFTVQNEFPVPNNSWSGGILNSGTSWNRLKVIREGASIAVYVNNHHLTTVTDGSFTGLRRVGLLAYSPSSGSIDARFDDFALYPASCGAYAAGVGFEMGEPGIHEAPVPPGLDQSP